MGSSPTAQEILQVTAARMFQCEAPEPYRDLVANLARSEMSDQEYMSELLSSIDERFRLMRRGPAKSPPQMTLSGLIDSEPEVVAQICAAGWMIAAASKTAPRRTHVDAFSSHLLSIASPANEIEFIDAMGSRVHGRFGFPSVDARARLVIGVLNQLSQDFASRGNPTHAYLAASNAMFIDKGRMFSVAFDGFVCGDTDESVLLDIGSEYVGGLQDAANGLCEHGLPANGIYRYLQLARVAQFSRREKEAFILLDVAALTLERVWKIREKDTSPRTLDDNLELADAVHIGAEALDYSVARRSALGIKRDIYQKKMSNVRSQDSRIGSLLTRGERQEEYDRLVRARDATDAAITEHEDAVGRGLERLIIDDGLASP